MPYTTLLTHLQAYQFRFDFSLEAALKHEMSYFFLTLVLIFSLSS